MTGQVLVAAVREGLISLSPNTGQKDLPSSFSWQCQEALITVLGLLDSEFLLKFREVTVSKADSSNPFIQLECQNYIIPYTGTKSQK